MSKIIYWKFNFSTNFLHQSGNPWLWATADLTFATWSSAKRHNPLNNAVNFVDSNFRDYICQINIWRIHVSYNRQRPCRDFKLPPHPDSPRYISFPVTGRVLNNVGDDDNDDYSKLLTFSHTCRNNYMFSCMWVL